MGYTIAHGKNLPDVIPSISMKYKWANALVPPTPFQECRKECAYIYNIYINTYIYTYL